MKLSKNTNGNTAVVPSVRNFFDNFWNVDNFFSEDIFKMRNSWMPAVNIKDNNGNFEIEVAAPGFTKKDFDVKIENGALFISAVKEESTEDTEDNYTRKEFSYNSFQRSFALPENADTSETNATYTDGVLKLTLKKTEEKSPSIKQIDIN
jgi:HSP20 family protein